MGSATKFKGFTVTGGSYGIVCDKGAVPVISNCIITKNTLMGVMLYQSTVNITNCIIRNNDGLGIFANSVGIYAKNNLIYDNNEGFTIFGPYTGGIIRNNTIVNNKNYGIKTEGEMKLSISNCIIRNNGVDVIGRIPAYSCFNEVNDTNGTGNIHSDPCFVDADANNFHISIRSPCVNAGDPNEALYKGETDIDGEPRVIGGRVDIGADETKVSLPAVKQ
jgi:hypothetical protein